MAQHGEHIIHTVLLDVTAANEETWLQLDAALSSHAVAQACNGALQPWDDVEKLHRVQRLEIDLGHIDADALDLVQDRLKMALQTALIKQVGKPPRAAGGKKNTANAAIHETKSRWQEILLHYISSGKLPWYVEDSSTLVADIRRRIAANPLQYWQLLQAQALSRVDQIRRAVALAAPLEDASLLGLFTDTRVANLVQRMRAQYAPQMGLWAWLQETVDHLLIPLIWRNLVMQEDARRFLKSLALLQRQQQSGGVTEYAALNKVVQQWIRDTWPAAGEQAPWNRLWQAVWASKDGDAPGSTNQKKIGQGNRVKRAEADIVTPAGELIENIENYAMEGDAGSADTQWVSNAGLVLLNPAGMLATWREQGWVREKEIAGTEGLRNMCLWMHCLVWGAEKPPMEYDLLLARIWCQVPGRVHIPLLPAPTEAMQQLADAYLERIIAAWPQLKNTSPDGLRTGFLQRQGVLQPSPAGWQLHVEGKAQDILLQYLPWSYSIIKLPWMDKAFFTQWNTGT